MLNASLLVTILSSEAGGHQLTEIMSTTHHSPFLKYALSWAAAWTISGTSFYIVLHEFQDTWSWRTRQPGLCPLWSIAACFRDASPSSLTTNSSKSTNPFCSSSPDGIFPKKTFPYLLSKKWNHPFLNAYIYGLFQSWPLIRHCSVLCCWLYFY